MEVREADYTESRPAAGSRKGELLYNTKTVKAGEYLYVDCYPTITAEAAGRAGKTHPQTEKQRQQNIKRAQRSFEILANANFGPGDYFATLTHRDECSEEQARRDIRNYIARIRRRAEKAGITLKYLYVTEGTQGAQGMRWHTHIIMTGGWIGRDELEALWGKGLTNMRRVQNEETGLRGISRYMTRTKQTQDKLMTRRFAGSQNLTRPQATVSRTKITRGAIWKIAQDQQANGKEKLEKLYPGYRIVEDIEISYSDFLPGIYLRAMLKKR